jgi:hypothetical protein
MLKQSFFFLISKINQNRTGKKVRYLPGGDLVMKNKKYMDVKAKIPTMKTGARERKVDILGKSVN